MSMAELQELERTSVIGSYARQPVQFVRGEGARLWDDEGNEYLDFLCGISVTNLGHCNPRVVEAVRDQLGRLEPNRRSRAKKGDFGYLVGTGCSPR